MQWLIGVNALRVFAIVLIVIYHLFADILPGGFIAVEIFFTISGFLIFTKLIRQFSKDRKIPYFGFIASRLVRLLPQLLFCIAISLAFAFLVHPDVLAGIRANTLAAATFTTNIKELITGGSYENTISPNLFEHTWFLALEMQFYLLAPIITTLIMGAFKKNRKGVCALGWSLFLLSVISIGLMILYGGIFEMYDRAYFALDSHMGAFCLGGMLAALNYLFPRTPRAKKVVPAVGLVLSIATIVILSSKLIYSDAMTYIFGLPFTAVLTVIMIFCIIKLQPNIHVRRRINLPLRAMESFGKYSYALYLFHWPIMIIFSKFLEGKISSDLITLIIIVLSLIFSFISTRWINVGRLKQNLSSGKLRGLSTCVTILTALVVSSISLIRIPEESGITKQLDSMHSDDNTSATFAKVDYFNISTMLESTEKAFSSQLESAKNNPNNSQPQTSRAAPDVNSAQVLVIGDSVTLGAKQALESTINGVYVDALESRGIWTARGILANYAAAGKLPDLIVISLITNEATITDGLLQGLVDVAGPGHDFIFVTGYAGPQQPREVQNRAVKDYASKHENVYIADWWELSHDNWSLMYADHIHLNPEGRSAYSNLLNNVIRSIKP